MGSDALDPTCAFFCSVFCCLPDLNQLQERLSEPNIPAGSRQPRGWGADGWHGQDLSILREPAENWEYLIGEGTLSCPYGHFWTGI